MCEEDILLGFLGLAAGGPALLVGLRRAAQGKGPVGDRIIVELDMGTLVAGTQLRGSFSEKLNGLKDEVKKAEKEACYTEEALSEACDTLEEKQKAHEEAVAKLKRAAELISERQMEYGGLMAVEVGKTRLAALAEVEEAADLIRYYATAGQMAAAPEGPACPAGPDGPPGPAAPAGPEGPAAPAAPDGPAAPCEP